MEQDQRNQKLWQLRQAMTQLKLFMIAVGLCVVVSTRLDCQSSDVFDCLNACMPFRFCNGVGGEIQMCTKNPHTVYAQGRKFIPFRQPYPSCFFEVESIEWVDGNGNPINYYLEGLDQNFYDVFVTDDQYQDIIVAEGAWEGLCPPSGGDPECCVYIRSTQEPADFPFGPTSGPRQTAARTLIQRNLNTCEVECDFLQSYIIINSTDEWYFENKPPDWNDWVDRMWFTGTACPMQVANRTDVHLISLREVVMHEIGHWYGMVHFNEGESSPGPDCPFCHDYVPSLMWNGPEPNGQTIYDRDARGLSLYDECAFKKLYCPDEVGLAVEILPELFNPNPDFEIYPNPVDGIATVGFYIEEAGTVNVSITDVLGKELVNSAQEVPSHGRYSAKFDTRDLPSGYYFCAVTLKNRQGVSSIIGYGVIKAVK